MFWIAEVKDLYDDSILYWIVQYWQGYIFEKMKLSSTKKKIFACLIYTAQKIELFC